MEGKQDLGKAGGNVLHYFDRKAHELPYLLCELFLARWVGFCLEPEDEPFAADTIDLGGRSVA